MPLQKRNATVIGTHRFNHRQEGGARVEISLEEVGTDSKVEISSWCDGNSHLFKLRNVTTKELRAMGKCFLEAAKRLEAEKNQ